MKEINNITDLFLRRAQECPDKIAIIDKDEKISYGELEKQVVKTAAYFRYKGIGKGDRVMVFVPMNTDLYRIVLALFYLGATAVFLDEWSDRKRLKMCCEIADCKGFIGGWKARVFAFFSSSLRKIPLKLSKSKQRDEKIPVSDMQADDAALITFTTGSTGTPKAALRTHNFLYHQFQALISEIELDDSTVSLTTLPIVLFMNLGYGCTSVIPDINLRKLNKFKPEKLVQQIQFREVTQVIASPFLIKGLSQYLLKNEMKLSSLQNIYSGGAPVFPSDADQYLRAFPYASTIILYGSTEAEPISSIQAETLNETDIQRESGLPVGSIAPVAEVKILRIQEEAVECNSIEQLNKMCMDDNEIGEIIVFGPHVLKSYFKNPVAFRQNKIPVNDMIWHRTGDAGFLRDGELFLTGRVNQMIKRDNSWLSPFLIENQLLQIHGIQAGTILKVEDEIVVAVESSLKKTELSQMCSKIPFDTIQKIKEIPRDPRHNSKVDYEKLKEMI